MNDFFIYYVKGRVFEWAMALAMLLAGVELLIWDDVLTFGAFHWMLPFMSQRLIGLSMFLVGWIRLSALMLNGQLLFGRRTGWVFRGICAVLSAAMWAQFSLALLELSINQGFPSVGLPFWTMLVLAELLTAYSVGSEWKK